MNPPLLLALDPPLAVTIADTWRARLTGLLACDRLEPGAGLLLVPGGSVHTLGMRFPLDLLFLDREHRVLHVAAAVRPWRVAFAPSGTAAVLELAAGGAAARGLVPGSVLPLPASNILSSFRT